jgi:hypothetical protein
MYGWTGEVVVGWSCLSAAGLVPSRTLSIPNIFLLHCIKAVYL